MGIGPFSSESTAKEYTTVASDEAKIVSGKGAQFTESGSISLGGKGATYTEAGGLNLAGNKGAVTLTSITTSTDKGVVDSALASNVAANEAAQQTARDSLAGQLATSQGAQETARDSLAALLAGSQKSQDVVAGTAKDALAALLAGGQASQATSRDALAALLAGGESAQETSRDALAALLAGSQSAQSGILAGQESARQLVTDTTRDSLAALLAGSQGSQELVTETTRDALAALLAGGQQAQGGLVNALEASQGATSEVTSKLSDLVKSTSDSAAATVKGVTDKIGEALTTIGDLLSGQQTSGQTTLLKPIVFIVLGLGALVVVALFIVKKGRHA
jgi:hypothetical protein